MMRNPRLALVPLAIILLTITFPFLSAQQDVRLSSPRRQGVMGDDILIQSAAAIGNRRMVVWGATHGTITDARPILVMSLLQGSTPIGEPVRLTSLDACPTSYAQVVALGGRFLVLWNDHRNGRAGAYMRVFTGDGIPVTDEVRLYTRWIDRAGILVTTEGAGYRLLWSDAGGDTIRTCSLSSIGAIVSPPRFHGIGRIQSYSRPRWAKGWTMVDRGDSVPLIIANNGAERSLNSAAEKFGVPYFILDDSSVVSLFGDTVRSYASILDSVPSRVSLLPRSDGVIPGTRMLSIDKYERPVVFHATSTVDSAGAIIVSLIRRVEGPAGHWHDPVVTDSMILWAPGRKCEHASVTPMVAIRRRNWGNRVSLGVSFEGTESADCPDGPRTRPIAREYDVVIDGYGQVSDGTPDMFQLPSAPSVARLTNGDSSEVAVAIGGTDVHLGVPVPSRLALFDCLRPGIDEYGGMLMVGWLTAQEDTVVSEGEWRPWAATQIPYMHTLSSTLFDPLDRLRRRDSRVVEMLRTNAITMLSVTSRWKERDNEGVIRDTQMLSLSLPTDIGWWQVVRVDAGGGAKVRRITHAFDPLLFEIISAWGLYDQRDSCVATRAIAVTQNGGVIWKIDSLDIPPTTGFWAIPIADEDFACAGHRQLHRFSGGKRVASVDIDESPDDFSLRLPGPLILRAHVEGDTLVAQILDLDGVSVTSGHVRVPGGFSADLFLVLNPRDSTLTFLSGSPNGVVMVRMDQRLTILQPATIVSDGGWSASWPAGIYRNDSLFIVWETLRDSAREIYGRVVPPGRVSGVASGKSIANLPVHLSISPNPARDRALLTLPGVSPAGAVIACTVVDLFGRQMLNLAFDGDRPLMIPTSELPSGVYQVRVSVNGEAWGASLVVVR